ncbi:MAG: hypothetical protein HZB91_03735 [Elusimicrobia bacterium]|nr:hypothetical protein [Elusimicrobiota bacterium]
MVRTQVLFEESQYRWLKSQAAKGGKSLSGLLRELVEKWRTVAPQTRRKDPLFRLIGAFEDGADVAVQHDRYLYGSGP